MSNKNPRFLQIHTLHSYPAALLNRDDSGLAKRLQYGGQTRTRISSQCLKRHWRTAEGAHAFSGIDGFEPSIRSKETVNKLVIKPIAESQNLSEETTKVLEDGFNKLIYGKKGAEKKGRQAKSIDEHFKKTKKNIDVLSDNTQLPGGLAAALFGRMVTSDTSANIDAAIHVAHAFTIHAEESESDYFSVVDDLSDPDEADAAGAAHIGDTELTAGLFYGYVVVDVPALISNTSGVKAQDWLADDTDRSLAADIVNRLIPLIATVTPGAKLGSTAPYSWASWLMVEASDTQPRSLADAFRKPVNAQLDAGLSAINNQLTKFDAIYGASEARRCLCTEDVDTTGASKLNLEQLSDWAAAAVKNGSIDE